MKKKLIILIISLLIAINCSAFKGEDKKDNTGLVAILLASKNTTATNANCTTSSVAAIASKLSQVPSQTRTKYTISGCGSSTEFSSIGLTSASVTTGAIGTSTSSLIGTSGDVTLATSKGGTNVEVTFTINTASGYLDVIGYGAGTTPTLSGPTYRFIADAQPQYKKSSDGSFANMSKGSAVSSPTTALGTSYTFCLDFQYTAMGMSYMNGFNKACSEVTSTERGSMMNYPLMQMMNVPSYATGSKIGFVLNGATITSFTIGTIISETE